MTEPCFFPVAGKVRTGIIRGIGLSDQEDRILLEEVAGCVQRGKCGKIGLFQDGTAMLQAIGVVR